MGNVLTREYVVNFDENARTVLDLIEGGDRLGPLPEKDLPFYAHLTGVYLRNKLVGFFHNPDYPSDNQALLDVIRHLRDYNIHFFLTGKLRETLETSHTVVLSTVSDKRSVYKRQPSAGRDYTERIPHGVLALGFERPSVRHAVLGKILRMIDFNGERRMYIDTTLPDLARYLKQLRGHTSVELIMPWDNDVVLRIVRHFPLYRAMYAIFGNLRFVASFLPGEISAFLHTPLWPGVAFSFAFQTPSVRFKSMMEFMNIEWPSREIAEVFTDALEGRLEDESLQEIQQRIGGSFKEIVSSERETLQAHDLVMNCFQKDEPNE